MAKFISPGQNPLPRFDGGRRPKPDRGTAFNFGANAGGDIFAYSGSKLPGRKGVGTKGGKGGGS